MEDKELIKLIDSYLDESIKPEELKDLNDLLENSREFRDLFRHRVRLHADMSSYYEAENVDIVAFPAKQVSAKSGSLFWPSLFAAAALLLLYFAIPKDARPDTIIARISYSENAVWDKNKSDELKNGSYKLDDGLVELEFPNEVRVAVEGPAEFRLISGKTLSLSKGKLSAHVGKKGRGFEVITPDGKIIDLGTRFGVWVPETGSTEAHVFEGEINFVANEKVHNITESGAVVLENKKPVKSRADHSLFPMPGFNSPVKIANAGFDASVDYLHNWPQTAGLWGGDESKIVNEHSGVFPHSGKSMLRFVKPYLKHETDTGHNNCQVWQLIDLRHMKEQVALGGVSANLTSFVNRVSDIQGMKDFGISVIALNGEMSEAKNYWNRQKSPVSELMAQSGTTLSPDSDPQSWEKMTASLDIPSGTDYLLIQLSVQDFSDSATFNGYFADSVSLNLTMKPRKSHPDCRWSGNEGIMTDSANWQNEETPDWKRDRIIINSGAAKLKSKLELKQPLIIALGKEAKGSLYIAKEASLGMSANGELIIGYNEDSTATLNLEGTLRTAGRVFIGRNNASSTVTVSGGVWDASGGLIRMAQYGNRGTDTQALLEIINDGHVTATSFDMINDNAIVKVEAGSLSVVRMKIGGSNGSANLHLNNGSISIDIIKFTKLGKFYFDGKGILRLKGKYTAHDLLSVENSTWLKGENPLQAADLTVRYEQENNETFTVFSCE